MALHLVLSVVDNHIRAVFAHSPEQIFAATPLDGLPSLEELRADPYRQGRSLFNALGGAAFHDQLEGGDGVLLLECDADAAAIPWEYAAANNALLCCDYAVLRLVDRQSLGAKDQPPRLLVLCADPLEYQQGAAPPPYRLDFPAELAALERELHERRLLARRVPPTYERLISALGDGPALLHLSAHGSVVALENDAGEPYSDAALQLEDANGRSASVLGHDLRRRAPRGSLRLVLLSACRSAPLARALVEGGVPFALGMQHDFPDPQSAALAATFFGWLARGNDAAEALRQARAAIADENPGAAGLLVAYTCRDAWGALPLPDQPQVVDLDEPGDVRVPSWFTPPATGLLGRDAALAEIAELFSGGAPAVTINGAGGMGKTALAAAFVRRFGWRWRRVLGVSFAAAPVELARVCRELLEAMGQGQLAQQAQEEAEARERQILQYRRNRDTLEDQLATFGATPPLALVNQLRETEAALAALGATDVRTMAAERLQERLVGAVGGGDLVVLDNFESVLAPTAADAEQAAAIRRLLTPLLARGAKLLLTSREQPAGIENEALFPSRSGLPGLSDDAAAQLFLRHSTRARRPDAPEQHGRVAGEVARLTHGYPLAIALLAGEYDDADTSPEQFLANWPAMLARAGRPELNAHQITFAVAFERSFTSLSAEQQGRLLALRAFDVPFFAEGAALLWQLPNDDEANPTEEAMSAARRDLALFLRRNLLEVDGTYEGTDEPAAYRLQPVLRQELLRRCGGDDGSAQPGYGTYGVWLAKRAYGSIRSDVGLAQLVRQSLALMGAGTATLGGDEQRWHVWRLAWIRRQYGEVSQARAMLESALGDKEDATRIQSHIQHELATIHRVQGNFARAMELYEENLAISERLGDINNRGATLHEMAYIYRVQGDFTRAMELYEESIAIAERLGDTKGKSATLHEMAYIYRAQGNFPRAMDVYEESLSIHESLGEIKGKSATLHEMAYIYVMQGELARAMELYEESLAIKERLGDLQGKSATLHAMGYIYTLQGALARAMELYEESLAIKERIGDLQGKSSTLSMMANVFIQTRDLPSAQEKVEQAFQIAQQLGDREQIAFNMLKLGQVGQVQGDTQTALQRFRESFAIFEQLGMPRETQQVRELIAEAEQPAESQLDGLRRQVREAMPQAFADDDAESRAQFAAQLEAVAVQAAEGEEPGSPWAQLAEYLRACVALLRGQPFDRSSLLAADRAQLEAWERAAPSQQLTTPLPEAVVAALVANDDAALQAALQSLPDDERAAVLAELQRQMEAQVEQLSPEEQQALRAQMQQQQIAATAAQVQELAAEALRAGDAAARQALAAQIAENAELAAAGEEPGSPYDDLAAYLRAVAALLRGAAPPPVPPAYAARLVALQQVLGE